MKRIFGLSGAALLVLTAANAFASYPAGVWVKVQGVVFEPSASAPERIRIHGAAMVFDQSTGNIYPGYSEPAHGSFYYACPPADLQTCREEWTEVVANIDEPLEVCVGLGDQQIATGSLYAPGTQPSAPDTYPIAMGVLQGFLPCSILAEFLSQNPGSGGSGAGGSGTAVGGSAGSGGASGVGGSSTASGGSASGSGGSASGSGGSASGSGGSASGSGGAATGTGGGVTAGTTGADPTSTNSAPAKDEGCSISAVRAAPIALGWLGLAALAALAAARRRKA